MTTVRQVPNSLHEVHTYMPTFFLTHYFPKNFQSSPASAEAATAWFERLGPNLAGRGNPASETRRFGDCSNGPERAVAFTVISTDDLEIAVALAETWPLLANGGGVEVRELTMLIPTSPASV